MDQGLWEESKWEDADKKDIGLYNRFEGGICTKKRENLSLVQRRERESKRVYLEIGEKVIYSTIKVTTDCTSILYRKEGWEDDDGTRLLVS